MNGKNLKINENLAANQAECMPREQFGGNLEVHHPSTIAQMPSNQHIIH